MSLQIAQVRNDLLSKLGIEDVADASALALQDCVVAINAAMQMLQTAGQDYFTRETKTTALVAGEPSFTVDQLTQAIIGPVRWNGIPLRALLSRGEYDQFARIFLGETAYGPSDGDPIAYWVETVRRVLPEPTAGDIVETKIYLAPSPTEPAGTLVYDVIMDAPSYVVADLETTAILPIAQNYTESIFLPIARMFITRSSQFSRPDLLEQLTADAQTASIRLGFAGGFPNAVQGEPSRKVSG